MEKQIEEEMAEMLKIIEKSRYEWSHDVTDHTENEYIREGLLNAGYLKQKEGHWLTHAASYECSECGNEIEVYNTEDYDPVSDYDLRFCYYCGAKMKGAENAESN